MLRLDASHEMKCDNYCEKAEATMSSDCHEGECSGKGYIDFQHRLAWKTKYSKFKITNPCA